MPADLGLMFVIVAIFAAGYGAGFYHRSRISLRRRRLGFPSGR
jgi:hypothetical protein